MIFVGFSLAAPVFVICAWSLLSKSDSGIASITATFPQINNNGTMIFIHETYYKGLSALFGVTTGVATVYFITALFLLYQITR